MNRHLSASQQEACKNFYLQTLSVDELGSALDADSLNIVSILVSVGDLLKLDLYDLIDNFDEESFGSLSAYLTRLEAVVAKLQPFPQAKPLSED